MIRRPTGMSADDLFEELRGRLGRAGDPRFGAARKVRQRLVEFAEARAAVEEVNRVRGMALLIEQCANAGQSYLDLSDRILASVAAANPEDGSCYAAFPDLTPVTVAGSNP